MSSINDRVISRVNMRAGPRTPGDPKKIAAAIANSELKQFTIARRCGVTPAAVSQWKNQVSKPGAINLVRLSRVLGIDVRDLL